MTRKERIENELFALNMIDRQTANEKEQVRILTAELDSLKEEKEIEEKVNMDKVMWDFLTNKRDNFTEEEKNFIRSFGYKVA